MLLESHEPLDLVIIFLGTNDLKTRFNLTPYCVAQGAAKLTEQCQQFTPKIPHLLLVSPPHIVKANDHDMSFMYEGAEAKSRELAHHYRYFADKLGCNFFDAATVITSSKVDGVHFDEDAHRKLGSALAEEVRRILTL